MKIFYAFIIFVFAGIANLHGQELSRKIIIEKKGYKYNGIYLDKYDLKELLQEKKQASKILKSAKANAGFGNLLLTAGIGFITAPLYPAIGENKENRNPKLAGTFIGIGAGLLGISIPILRKANRQTKAAVELYNSGLSSNFPQKHQPELQIGFADKGPGLTLKF